MKLIKTKDEQGVMYSLSADNLPDNYVLSKQNCDEIFGVVNEAFYMNEYIKARHSSGECIGFIDGFNKAMALNKEKVFTLGDMRKAYEEGYLDEHSFEVVIQSLQQPTEIEVEIEMELEVDTSKLIGAIYGHKPKLDSSGCLILKKI
jgi:hypothetical protein